MKYALSFGRFIVFLSILPLSRLFSQGQDLRFDHITVEDGLSQSSVYCILQDHQGFMWFGTADGLNKYDGYDITVFKHREVDSNSLSSSTTRCLCEDRKGNLWVGTMQGLDLFDRDKNNFHRIDLKMRDPAGNATWAVYSIFEDTARVLWLSLGFGVLSYDPQTGKTAHYPGAISTFVQGGAQGRVWVGTVEGLKQLNPEGTAVVDVQVGGNGGGVNLDHVRVEAAAEDDTSHLLIGTLGRGVYRAETAGTSLTKLVPLHEIPLTNADAFQRDAGGILWIGGLDGGLVRFDEDRGAVRRYLPDTHNPSSINSTNVTCLFLDRSGLLWIGTDGGGVNKVDPRPRKFGLFRQDPAGATGLSGNFVKSIFEDHEGVLWIGTYRDGLNSLDRKNQKWRHFTHDPRKPQSIAGNTVTSICEDPEGSLWFGTGDGLDRYDRTTGRFTHYKGRFGAFSGVNISNSVTVLHISGDGSMWVGTEQGIGRFDPTRDGFTWYGTILTRSIFDGPDGSIWVGGYSALYRVDPKSGVLTSFQNIAGNDKSISNSSVRAGALLPDGSLWIGTEEGLNRYDAASGTFTRYYAQDGFPSDFIYGILPDARGNLWMSTNEGVSLFEAAAKRFRHYGTEDGLQSEEFNTGAAFRSTSGELFFGGIGGFNSFFPDSMKDNPSIPPVVLTGFKKFDQNTPLGGDLAAIRRITLRYDESIFSLRYAGMEYTNTSRNRYAYQLEGFEKEWIDGGTRREVRYTHLDPGEYTFRVKASNNDGVWSDHPLEVTITIVPPFWKTSWFLGGSLIAGLVIVAGTARYVSQWNLRRTVLRLEQEHALERERARISKDMHDDVGASLTRITLLSDMASREGPGSGHAEPSIRKISDLAREVVGNLDEIVWAVDPKNDTLDSLAAYITEYTSSYFEPAPVHCRFDIPDSIPSHHLSADVRHNIFRAVKEALHNILKHSQATEVHLAFKLQDTSLEIVIADNGIGFSPETSPRFSDGLTNMRKRMDDIGGSFAVVSRPGKGTTVTFRVRLLPK